MSKNLIVNVLGNAKQFAAEMDRAAGRTRRFSKMAGIAGTVLAGGLVVGLSKSVEAASKFQSEMELVKTQAGGTTEEVEHMSKALIGLAANVGTGPEELAKGLFHIESAGYRGAKALEVLKISAEGAKVGHADLEQTTNALVGAMNANAKGTGNAAHAMGVLNAIIGAGNMRMDDLTEALGTGVLKSAKAFGVSIQDVGAALAEMTRAGIPAVNAATGLKMAMASVAGPSKLAIGALESIGLKSDQLAKTMRAHGLIAAMREFKAHMEAAGLSATQQGSLIIDIFGRRAATPILALTQNIKGVGKTIDSIKANTAAFGSNWEETQKTAAFQTDKFKASVSALEIGIGTALLPAVTKVTAKLAEFMGFLSQHEQLTKALIIGLGGLAVALMGVAVASFIAGNALTLGIGLAVTGVAIGVALLITHFDQVVGWLKANWVGIATVIAGPLGFAVAQVITHWGQIKAAFTGAFSAIIAAASTAWATIKNTFTAALDAIKSAFAAAVNTLKELALKMVLVLVEPFSHLPGFLGGWARRAKDAVHEELNKMELGKIGNRKTAELVAAIRGAQGPAAAGAYAIGAAIKSGVLGGAAGLGAALGAQMASQIASAVQAARRAIGAHSPSRMTATLLGKPIVEGIALGVKEGETLLTTQLRRTLMGASNATTKLTKGLFREPLKAAKQEADTWAESDGASNMAGVGLMLGQTFTRNLRAGASGESLVQGLALGGTRVLTDDTAPGGIHGTVPGGAGVYVNVTVNGPALGTTATEVADTIYRELLRRQGRNGNLGFA